MKIAATSQSFTGYKNIITGNFIGSQGALSFITAQLDNVGHPDLDEFKKMKQFPASSSKFVDSDIITIMRLQGLNHNPILFIDSQNLLNGKDLKILSNLTPFPISENEFKDFEKFSLKAYTLAASLTRRMMNENLSLRDAAFSKVIKQFMAVMTNITKNNDSAFDVLDYSLRKNETCKKAAEIINKTIAKTMRSYF